MSEEVFAGWWHAVAGASAGAMFGHNLKQWARTRKLKNAVNVLLYGAFTLYELREAKGHWSKPCS